MTAFDVIDLQPKAYRALANSWLNQRVASTYLFWGRPGLGGWSLYLALSALLNCESPHVAGEGADDVSRPCGQCRNCRNIQSHNFEGLMFAVALPPLKKGDDAIDMTGEVIKIKSAEPFATLSGSGSRNISVQAAREIKRRLAAKPPKGLVRTVLFHQMEYMRPSSADALLKMIEEPPPNTVIVMTARRPEVLLPTIRSRAQEIRLDRIQPQRIEAYLGRHYGLEPDAARLYSRLSDGCLGAALAQVAEEDGMQWRADALQLFDLLVQGCGPELISRLHETIDLRNLSEAEQLLGFWQSLLRDCLHYQVTGSEEAFTNPDFAGDIKRLSSRLPDTRRIDAMLGHVKMTLADLRLNVHIPGALAALTIKMQAASR
ncbi:MAG: hypothetical protein ABIE70_09170 [bacterium]